MSRLARQAAEYDKQARSGIYTSFTQNTAQDPRVGGNMTMAYPRRGFEAFDNRDELMRVKMDLIKNGKTTGMTPLGLVTVTPQDLEWLQKKQEVEAKFNFDRWIGENFNTNDVVTRQWLQQIYPEYHDAREQAMVDRAKFALRIHLLMMRGPKDHKDLVLYWALQQGLVKLDRDWDRIGAGQIAQDSTDAQRKMGIEQKRFRKGLMNPWTYKSDVERARNATDWENPFAPTGSLASQLSGAQAGIPGGFGLATPKNSRYTNFYNFLTGSSNPNAGGGALGGLSGLPPGSAPPPLPPLPPSGGFNTAPTSFSPAPRTGGFSLFGGPGTGDLEDQMRDFSGGF
jgi:hypothetical protein